MDLLKNLAMIICRGETPPSREIKLILNLLLCIFFVFSLKNDLVNFKLFRCYLLEYDS